VNGEAKTASERWTNVIGPFSMQAPTGCSYDCSTSCSEDITTHLALINAAHSLSTWEGAARLRSQTSEPAQTEPTAGAPAN